MCFGRGVFYICVYCVLIVFNDVYYWKFLKWGYVEVFIDLFLIGCVIVKIVKINVVVLLVFVCKCEICFNWWRGVDDFMIVKEIFFFIEYMYGVVFVVG